MCLFLHLFFETLLADLGSIQESPGTIFSYEVTWGEGGGGVPMPFKNGVKAQERAAEPPRSRSPLAPFPGHEP